MNPTTLLQFFDTYRERAEPLVLVTVYETAGSTYSKAGAQMLVNADGVFRGMLSGGCLEGDLAIRARQVLDSASPQTVTYDLGKGDDELWGMGVGCDGLMRMQLQSLLPEDGYAPFAEIAQILRGDEAREVAMPLADGSQGELTVLVEPPPQVLVLGAGLDAEPVVRFAAELGWRCTVVDHRKAYIDNGDFAAATATHCVAADKLSNVADLARFDLAIVMSHHLVSDRDYLLQLADSDIAYIGLLGPHNRRDRLLRDLGTATAGKLEKRLYGPAGIAIGGRGPAAIALSIVAQMQQKLAGA
ncbi:MAG: XdhC family protein [Gammaproteobacteria bacterium]|nr:XdhC family protein [Gammaproteobacteria bacterium]